MNMRISIIMVLVGISVLLAACSSSKVTSFEECVAAGNSVMESHPRQCSDGETTFTEPFVKNFVSEDPQQCMVLNFRCDEGLAPFFDDNGCGCTNDPEVVNQGNGEQACTKEYVPVCGEIQIQCVTTPCDPLKTTFGNRCEAENAGAQNIVDGVCVDEVSLEGACLSFDGTWLAESQECEWMPQEMCEELGGSFNECESACRNNPDAEACTMQCVTVCDFS